jgi:hypothetical protein
MALNHLWNRPDEILTFECSTGDSLFPTLHAMYRRGRSHCSIRNLTPSWDKLNYLQERSET